MIAATAPDGTRLHLSAHSVSGYQGVFESAGRYQAQVRVGGKQICIGIFPTKMEAAIAVARALGEPSDDPDADLATAADVRDGGHGAATEDADMAEAGDAGSVPKVGAARMETSMQMPAQAEMVQQQQYAASVGTDQQPSMLLQPQVTRRLTWQEHLVGWQIQVEQYTSGARTHRTTPSISAHTARSMFAPCSRSPYMHTHVFPPANVVTMLYDNARIHVTRTCCALPFSSVGCVFPTHSLRTAPAGAMPAIVGGQVRNWDAQRGLFVLVFDNGSVEPAYLPQPTVKIVDARGTVLDWESFFNYCRSVGMCVLRQVPTRPKPSLSTIHVVTPYLILTFS